MKPSAKSDAPPQATSSPPVHPTLDDIAAAVGMSASTVSRAMSGSPLVREQTRARILDAAKTLGFEPDRIASSLSTGSSAFVGMVVPDAGDAFYAHVLRGARRELERSGYHVLLMETDHDPQRERDALRTLIAHRVAGILLATAGGYEPCRAPVVFFPHMPPGPEIPGAGLVASANAHGMDLLVEHLRWHGHTRIGYIGGEAGRSTADERYEGFRSALAREWLAVPGEYIRRGDPAWTPEAGERATRELLALDPPPTAIVASTDWFLIGALRALRAAGTRVPQDIALVGFDDPPFSDLIDPPLTVISFDAGEIGAKGAELILRQVSDPSPPVEVRLPVKLIVRRSCGCAEQTARAADFMPTTSELT
ncbi:MAG TPA: LacI family DNA-binding transcriptional regulator [Solirubrobacteraceae bacterium]|jgi:DNA-binding LacI/PurR family transcriptional regulator|nr:LacI family DNA-binding transcriptional regulator [Solirubrobacteraceae bacterium]